MCGIVGYIGERCAAPVLVNGLKKLEYRGYDSAGVAVFGQNNLKVVKARADLQHLKKRCQTKYLTGRLE